MPATLQQSLAEYRQLDRLRPSRGWADEHSIVRDHCDDLTLPFIDNPDVYACHCERVGTHDPSRASSNDKNIDATFQRHDGWVGE